MNHYIVHLKLMYHSMCEAFETQKCPQHYAQVTHKVGDKEFQHTHSSSSAPSTYLLLPINHKKINFF